VSGGLGFVQIGEGESSDITERTALAFEDTLFVLPADLMAGHDQYFELCSSPADLGANPNTTLMVVRSINNAAGLGLGNEIATLGQFPRETLYLMSDITQEVATKAKLAVTRLGDNPVDEVSSKLAFRAGYARLFRSGLRFRTDFRFQGSERNFLGKSLDPAFGGFGLRNEFPSYLTFSLDMPLGKNRGSVSTAAPQRASEFSLLAERDTCARRSRRRPSPRCSPTSRSSLRSNPSARSPNPRPASGSSSSCPSSWSWRRAGGGGARSGPRPRSDGGEPGGGGT